MHMGILNDQIHRRRLIDAGVPLCPHCDGTGNELYSMYHRCPLCLGSGEARRLGPPAPRVPWSPGIHQPDCPALLSPAWLCDCGADRHEVQVSPLYYDTLSEFGLGKLATEIEQENERGLPRTRALRPQAVLDLITEVRRLRGRLMGTA